MRLDLRDEKGCFGGGGSTPAVSKPPDPTPAPMPTSVNSLASAQDRARNLDSYKYGLASTIKTSASGITGQGAELKAPAITGVDKTGKGGGGSI